MFELHQSFIEFGKYRIGGGGAQRGRHVAQSERTALLEERRSPAQANLRYHVIY